MFVRVIGLVGRARVGKDTVADYILSKYGTYLKVRLAQPIKDAICALYGFTPQQVEGSEKEEIDVQWGISPRQAMVQLTDSMMTFMGHDFFTKRLFNHYKEDSIIIPDIRYEHDIHNIHSLGGITIKVERSTDSNHVFEQKIDGLKCDFTIYNNGSLEDLYHQVDVIINHYLNV